MNTSDISKHLGKIHNSLMPNVFPANRLPIYMSTPVYMISNLDPDTKPGSHWVAIFIDVNGVGEYFDTFGRKPHGYHLTFLKRNSCKWTYSSKIIQNIFSSLCGEYCLLYLYLKLRGISLRDFEKMFTVNTVYNDNLLKVMFKSFFYL